MARPKRVAENVRSTIAEYDERIKNIRSAIADLGLNRRATYLVFTTYETVFNNFSYANHFGELDELTEAVVAIARDGDKTRKLIDDFARTSAQRRICILEAQLAPDWCYQAKPVSKNESVEGGDSDD